MRTRTLFDWIQERHAIYERRAAGQPKPWTTDPILQNYRFCNVYRELDTVTQWIKTNWRDPHTTDPDVWFAMAVARLVNWPDTLEQMGYPVPWFDEQADANSLAAIRGALNFEKAIERRQRLKQKTFTAAYIIPQSAAYKSKAEFLTHEVLSPLWEKRDYVRESTFSCAALHKRLMEFRGIGSFLAGQIVCDTKYTRLMDTCGDWWEFACPGPGSRRGLNRVMDRPVDRNWHPSDWRIELLKLKALISPMVEIEAKMPPLHAQDLQNVLCEFDKYERVRLGEGKPRRKYDGV